MMVRIPLALALALTLLCSPGWARKPKPPAKPLAVILKEGFAVSYNEKGDVTRTRNVPLNGSTHILPHPKGKMAYLLLGNQIYWMDLYTLAVKKLYDIPPLDNPCLSDHLSDNLQAPRDFAFSHGGKGLCITLMDRNVNMMDTEATVFVDLRKRTVVAETTFQPGEGCAKKIAKVKPCEADYSFGFRGNSAGIDEKQVKLTPESCSVTLASGKRLPFPIEEGRSKSGACSLYAHGMSKSRRFAAFSAITGSCDYIHRELRVLDLKTRSWVESVQESVVGESTIVWSTVAEALQVDNTLYFFSPKFKRIEADGTLILLR
jgi:hypothetical protein